MFLSSVTLVTKAVAVIELLDNPCILALGTAATDVELAGAISLFMPSCGQAHPVRLARTLTAWAPCSRARTDTPTERNHHVW